MKIGLVVNHTLYTPDSGRNMWDVERAIGQAADESGFDSLWHCDHFMWGPFPKPDDPAPLLEAFVVMGGLAEVTKRVKLGHLVLGVPYRNPAHTVKMATTLDIMSQGRFILGLGAAWMEREFDAYGYTFDPTGVRMQKLEEAVKIAKAMWTDRPASFEGRHYRINGAINDPPPVQKPHPPIMIGGSGEKVTLRLVAQYGDWCNLGGPPERVAQKIGVLREHCDRLGRNIEDITITNYVWSLLGKDEAAIQKKLERFGRVREYLDKSANRSMVGTKDQIVEKCRAYAEAGSRYITVEVFDDIDADAVREWGEEIIPAVASL